MPGAEAAAYDAGVCVEAGRQAPLTERVIELAREYGRYGCRRVTGVAAG